MHTSSSLDANLVPTPGLEKVHYIPHFITGEEEGYLLQQIANVPKPKWKALQNRRLQVWGGSITKAGKLLQEPLPPFLNKYPDIIGRIRQLDILKDSKIGEPNHVIINEYLPGQGIMPHQDGPRYHPVVCTISLGSHAVVNYYRYSPRELDASTANDKEEEAAQSDMTMDSPRPVDPKPILSLLLEPRSLVITSSTLYTRHLHGIAPVTEDRVALLEAVDSDDDEQISIANGALLGGIKERETTLEGGVLERGTRVSLTCRAVEEVLRTSKLVR